MTSLRTRLAIGAFFWSIGLFSATTIVITLYPQLARPIQRVHQHGIMAALVAAVAMAAGFELVRAALTNLIRFQIPFGMNCVITAINCGSLFRPSPWRTSIPSNFCSI